MQHELDEKPIVEPTLVSEVAQMQPRNAQCNSEVRQTHVEHPPQLPSKGDICNEDFESVAGI